MRILMLGWELPPVNSGGLGVACYHLCRHLADQGVSIDFVMPYPVPPAHAPQFMRVHTVHAEPAPAMGAYTAWSKALHVQKTAYGHKVRQLVAHNKYDAIHAHDWLTFEAGVQAKELTGLPLVAHVHSTEYDRAGGAPGNPLVHEIEQTALLLADRVVAVSNATKSQLIQRYGLPETSIDVVYSATEPDLLSGTSAAETTYIYLRAMRQYGYKIVVSLGRLTVQKGLTYLLEAARLALQQNPKLLFLVVGDGEQRDELIAKSAELGIARSIIFTGFLRGKAWRDAYAIGDIFVMSSVSEPYGLSALEAAHSGNALLLTKQSGVSEVLRHTLQFDFWDTHKLADYILNIAAHDPLRLELAANALAEARTVRWQTAAERLQTIYRAAGVAV